MKTMKIWRKSQLSESRANSFANGRTGAIYAIAFMMLAAFSLASCSSDDDNEDKVEQVTLYVSAETGTYQNVPDNNYVEGMLIKENGAANWECVSFMEITGFTYERGIGREDSPDELLPAVERHAERSPRPDTRGCRH